MRACRAAAMLLLVAACAGTGDDGGSVTVIRAVNVIDVIDGRVIPDQTVIVRDSAIVTVGPERDITVPDGATVVEGRGRYLTPGFADMHVHLYTEGDLYTYVANGITTVRNMVGDSTVLRMRRRVRDGSIVGPRIVTAGPVVEAAPLSHPENVGLESPGNVRAELRRQRDAGYDFVKVYNQLDRSVYDSLLAIGRELGITVVGHVPFDVGIDGALAARQRSIEHFRGYVDALANDTTSGAGRSFRARTLAWGAIDTARIASLVARTVQADVWNVPTFVFTVHELSPAAEHARLVAREETRFLSLAGLPSDRATGYTSEFRDEDFAAAQRGLAGQFRLLRALDAAGGGWLVGTDSWLSGFAFADEMALMVRAGLSPARVLRAATADAARFLGEERRWGTIAPGLRADLVLLDADPLRDIGAVRRIHAVVMRGRLLTRDSIDARLSALGDSIGAQRRRTSLDAADRFGDALYSFARRTLD